METQLTVFNEFETGLVLLETANKEKEFPDTPEGLADRRVWYRKLRKGTNALAKIRKEAGADYLRLKREVDSEAGTIQIRLDVMEMPHKIILDAEEAKVQAEIDALAAKAEAAAKKDEDERLAWLEYREKIVAEMEAKTKAAAEVVKAAEEAIEAAKQAEVVRLTAIAEGKAQAAQEALEALEKAEQEKINAAAKAETEKIIAAEKAEQDKQDAIAEEQAKAHQKENDRIAAELAEKNKQDEIAKKDATRVADLRHRANIEHDIYTILRNYINASDAGIIQAALIAGEIPHINIVY